ncbi:unknown [Clostridium sp. CAG:575]|nr:unknown [Clostridium sp. CAG:575]
MEENKLKRFNKIFPWYDGLSGDLLFWIAIDTLFLTVVKKFTAAQIVSLTSISMIINKNQKIETLNNILMNN